MHSESIPTHVLKWSLQFFSLLHYSAPGIEKGCRDCICFVFSLLLLFFVLLFLYHHGVMIAFKRGLREHALGRRGILQDDIPSGQEDKWGARSCTEWIVGRHFAIFSQRIKPTDQKVVILSTIKNAFTILYDIIRTTPTFFTVSICLYIFSTLSLWYLWSFSNNASEVAIKCECWLN